MAKLTGQDGQGLHQACGEDKRLEACVGESVSGGFRGSGLEDEQCHSENARRVAVGESPGLGVG